MKQEVGVVGKRWRRVELILFLMGFVLCEIGLIGEARLNRRNSFDQVNHKGVFIQLPFANPPTVRPPPYVDSYEECPEINHRENWVDTLCGDLNKGSVPLNPFKHKFQDGSSYPFEIIKNKTLQFFRHALPVLRNDKSLPKVARYHPFDLPKYKHHQSKRSLPEARILTENDKNPADEGPIAVAEDRNSNEKAQQARAVQAQWQKSLAASASRFCNNEQPKGSLLCGFYQAMWGKPAIQKQSFAQPNRHEVNRITQNPKRYPQQSMIDYSLHRTPVEPHHFAESKQLMQTMSAENMVLAAPATPCTSSAEYLTPVFARNHEGAWRYVVQIPREGYFTQTVEVTKCVETNCHFMEGSCLTSPRWQSLLVAEMFYPEASFPVTLNPGRISSNQVQQILKRGGAGASNEMTQIQVPKVPSECDGYDEIGCFQVRLFYDWFLIPGSCKCWKRPMDFTRVHQSH